MQMPKFVLALLVLAAAALAAGCGGDDGPAPLSKEEFISQADAICQESDAEVAMAAEEAGLNQKSSEQEINAFITDTVPPNVQQQADEIDALGKPEGDEEEITAIVEGLNSAVAETEEDPSSNAFAEPSMLAQEYGLQSCGQG